ncbi:hydrogenase small subunit [Candidatus Sulfurimonas marisnigri]|uniref:Hydrogenase small subunit n=1 Tax=Candidatus Sulfurimonas marisnigri TaxID=2740405 RepID=A0A7S7RPW1_9BACT|nr:hydrogenase small subunit [Candidatus Sulfurimonas marisnigri]QOY53984.1 hydrogenase small subunit [Candidatus Sulfurimonas marisnigri]
MENKALFEKLSSRLDELSNLPKLDDEKSISRLIEEKGFSRREFMGWAGAMTSMLMLPASFTPLVAKAAEMADRLPLVWLHMAECTGCSESLLRTATPSIDSLIFDYISLEYHETIMSAAGWQAEHNLESAMERYKGKYILMVEGGIPHGESDFYLTIGAHGKTGEKIAREASENAAAIFAIGTCSSFGGVQAAYPNPTNATALSNITNKSVINVPGCPPSESNIVGTLLHFILYGTLPALDAYNRPKWAYGLRIHDACERRGRFDAGEFVEQFGDDGAKNGYCLYKVGCKGPYTFNNCSKQRFNQGTSWPVQAGHGCMGCSEPDFWDKMGIVHEPLGNRLYHTVFGGLGSDATADKIGVGILTVTAVGIAAHAAISLIKKPKE